MNNKKNILIIGPTDSIWMVEYIKNILLNQAFNVWIIGKNSTQYRAFYEANGIRIIDNSCKSKIKIIRFFQQYVRPIISFPKKQQMDFLHIQYVNHYSATMANLLKKRVKKIVVSFWGSDLFRSSNKELMKQRKLLSCASIVTLCTKSMNDFFIKTYGTVFLPKTRIIDYGVNGLDAIDRVSLSKEECKKTLGIPCDRVAVTVGYNGSCGQQHLSVLQALSEMSAEYQKKMFVILPMTYSVSNQGYVDRIHNFMVEKCMFDFLILRDFMPLEKIAILCLASDYMIHAQTTDALSASVQEFIYAGNIVFNPVWIEYDELDIANTFYIKYANFNDLKEKIEENLSKQNTAPSLTNIIKNKEIIHNRSSWSVFRKKWLSLYEND